MSHDRICYPHVDEISGISNSSSGLCDMVRGTSGDI